MITKGKLRAYGTLDDIMRDIQQRRTFEIQLTEMEPVQRVANLVKSWMVERKQESEVNAAPAESIVRFTTSLSDRDITPLLSHLVGAGEAIAQFREVPTDLEDAFLSVAGDENEGDGVSEDQHTEAAAS